MKPTTKIKKSNPKILSVKTPNFHMIHRINSVIKIPKFSNLLFSINEGIIAFFKLKRLIYINLLHNLNHVIKWNIC